jgi:hypothetical protein
MTELTLGFLVARARILGILLAHRHAVAVCPAAVEGSIEEVLALHQRFREAWNGFTESWYEETGEADGPVLLTGFLEGFVAWENLAVQAEALARAVSCRTGQPIPGLNALRNAIGLTTEVASGARGLICPREAPAEEEWEAEKLPQHGYTSSRLPHPRAIATEPGEEVYLEARAVLRPRPECSGVVGRRLCRFP